MAPPCGASHGHHQTGPILGTRHDDDGIIRDCFARWFLFGSHGSVVESRCGFLALQLQAFVFSLLLFGSERRLLLDFGGTWRTVDVNMGGVWEVSRGRDMGGIWDSGLGTHCIVLYLHVRMMNLMNESKRSTFI